MKKFLLFFLLVLGASSLRAQTWTLTSPLYTGTPYTIVYNSPANPSPPRSSIYITLYAQAPGSSTWTQIGGNGGGTTTSAVTVTTPPFTFTVSGTWTLKAVDGSSPPTPTTTLSTLTRTVDKPTQSAVTISPASTTAYVGIPVRFTASGGTAGTYQWFAAAAGQPPGATADVTFNVVQAQPQIVEVRRIDPNYQDAVATASVTVQQAPQNLVFGSMPSVFNSGQPYTLPITAWSNGQPRTLSITFSKVGGDASTSIDFGNTSFSTIAFGAVVGTKPMTLRVTQAGDAQYASTYSDLSISITTIALSSAASFNYGDSYTAAATGGAGTGAFSWALSSTYTSSAPGASITPGGVLTTQGTGTVYLKVQKQGDGTNAASNWIELPVIQVNPRPITINLTGSKTYDGTTTATGGALAVASGTLASGDVLGNYTNTPNANAGPYSLAASNVSITNPSGQLNRTAFYSITPTGSYTINGIVLTSATIADLTYTGLAQTPTTITSPTGNTVSLNPLPPAQTNAGTYNTATVTGTINYSGTLTNVSWKILKATPTLGNFPARTLGIQTPSGYTVVASDLNATISGPPNGQVPTASGSVTYTIATGSPNGTEGSAVSIGTLLPIGSYLIQVNYTANGASNYNSRTFSPVTWNVVADSDGDGVPDYIEIQLGTDPNTPNAAETTPANPTGLKIQRPKS